MCVCVILHRRSGLTPFAGHAFVTAATTVGVVVVVVVKPVNLADEEHGYILATQKCFKDVDFSMCHFIYRCGRLGSGGISRERFETEEETTWPISTSSVGGSAEASDHSPSDVRWPWCAFERRSEPDPMFI